MSMGLTGVLNMPLPDDPTQLDLVTWYQIRDRMREAATTLAAQQERIEALENFISEVCDADPEWFSGKHPSDPAYDMQDTVDADVFYALQEDAKSLLLKRCEGGICQNTSSAALKGGQ